MVLSPRFWRMSAVLLVAGLLLAVLPLFLFAQADTSAAPAERSLLAPIGERAPAPPALPPVQPNQQPLDGWLDISAVLPAYFNVSDPGQAVTLTIANNHPTRPAEALAVTITLPANFIYLGTQSVTDAQGAVPFSVQAVGQELIYTLDQGTYDLDAGNQVQIVLRLATNCQVASGLSLQVTADYLSNGTAYRDIGYSDAITVQRGNLVVQKQPANQLAAVGDVITWTVLARNTGLGDVYDA